MELYRIVLAVIVLAILFPTTLLMNQINTLRGGSDKASLQKKEKQLKWCIRASIAVFLVVLAITMTRHYINLSAMHGMFSGSGSA